MQVLASAVSGLLFGLGLVVSGLINPAKVLGFLDLAGFWDPSLALTMGAAVVTTAIGYTLVIGRGRPLFGGSFKLPTRADIDASLVIGAALFGIGWGLVGYCPGPALAALSLQSTPTFLFVAAVLIGMVMARLLSRASQPNPAVNPR